MHFQLRAVLRQSPDRQAGTTTQSRAADIRARGTQVDRPGLGPNLEPARQDELVGFVADAAATANSSEDFLALLGHELRTPISAIASAVSVLEQVVQGDALAAEARDVIRRQTAQLLQFAEDMLDMSRVASGRAVLSREVIDLSALAQRVAARSGFAGQDAPRELRLTHEDAWIEADAARIEQVVAALLSAAAAVAAVGGPATLDVRVDDCDSVLLVRCAAPAASTALPSRLALAGRLAQLHGGGIAVRTSAAELMFELRLPSIDAPVGRLSTGHALRVLLWVESDEDIATSLHAFLVAEGHAVSVARDDGKAWSCMADLRPDIVIIDIALPLDDLTAATRARAVGYPGRMIALRGSAGDVDARQALAAGFDAQVAKPVDLNAFRVQLRTA